MMRSPRAGHTMFSEFVFMTAIRRRSQKLLSIRESTKPFLHDSLAARYRSRTLNRTSRSAASCRLLNPHIMSFMTSQAPVGLKALSHKIPLPRQPSCSFSVLARLYAPRSRVNTSKEKAAKEKARRKKKKHSTFKQYDLREAEQFSLCDAIR